MKILNNFFFEEIDGRAFGILRIIFYTFLFCVFTFLPMINLSQMTFELKTHVTIFDSFNDYFLASSRLAIVLLVWKVSLIMSLIGLFFRFSSFVALFTSGIVFSLHNAYSCGFHGANLFFLGIGILGLSGAGQYLSVDGYLLKRKGVEIKKNLFIWPIRLIQINFITMFFFAAIAKYCNSGFHYIVGDEFYSIILIKQVWSGHLSWIFMYLLDHPLLTQIIGAYVFIIEMVCPLAFLNKHILFVIICSIGIMQLLIYFNMGITSFNAMPAIYAFWINWDFVIKKYEKIKL